MSSVEPRTMETTTKMGQVPVFTKPADSLGTRMRGPHPWLRTRPTPGTLRAYSTVTLLARFRGWSTSQPRSFAM